MDYLNPNLCRNIMNQVNQSDLETTIFTDQIGGNTGTRGRGCGSCFTRLWDWMFGVSYDKNSVTARINFAFRGVSLNGLDQGSLRTFKTNLEAMEGKFNKQGALREDLQETITKIDAYLNRGRQAGTRRGNQMNRGGSAARVDLPRPRQSTRSTRRAQSAKVKEPTQTAAQIQRAQNEKVLVTISAREGTKYLEAIQACYGGESRYIGKVQEWVTDTYEEIYLSLGADIEKPLDQAQIQTQFETVLGQKILQYNLDKLSKKIPDLFTNNAYNAEQITDWLPGTYATGPLGQFMTLVPFSNRAIKHIQAKLAENSSPRRAKAQQKQVESPIQRHIKELKSQSDTQILGLPDRGSSRAQIKRAYHKSALQFHPDKLSGRPLIEQEMGKESFNRIHRAYSNLIRYEDFYDSQIGEGLSATKAREYTNAFTYAFTHLLGEGAGESDAHDLALEYVSKIKQQDL